MEPQDILRDEVETFEAKNDDYSDTWVITGIALSMLHDEPVQLNTETEHIINGNVHRLLDKILRGYHGAVVKDEMNYESTYDSFADAAVYCSMIASTLADEPTTRIEDAYTRGRGNEVDNGPICCSECGSEGDDIRWNDDGTTRFFCDTACLRKFQEAETLEDEKKIDREEEAELRISAQKRDDGSEENMTQDTTETGSVEQ